MKCKICGDGMHDVSYRAIHAEAQLWVCGNTECAFCGIPRLPMHPVEQLVYPEKEAKHE